MWVLVKCITVFSCLCEPAHVLTFFFGGQVPARYASTYTQNGDLTGPLGYVGSGKDCRGPSSALWSDAFRGIHTTGNKAFVD